MDFAVPAEHRVKLKESEKRNKYWELSRELQKQTMEHEGDGDTNCDSGTWNDLQMIDKGTGALGN